MTPNKRGAAQPSDIRPPKKRKPTVKFRLANDPAVEQIRATRINKRSDGKLGYRKMDTVRPAELPIVEEMAGISQDEGSFLTGELDHASHDHCIEGAPTTNMPAGTPKKKINTTSSKLQEWLSFRDDFFDELHRIDGRGDYRVTSTCYECKKEPGLYRCRDCFGLCFLHCKECLVRRHLYLPLHRIEVWNGSFFNKSNLRDLGLRIQLGHGGASCSSPIPAAQDFLVFDVSGVHLVAVDFCDCRSTGFVHKRNQLFRVGWFPATFDRPKTVFTLSVLKMFQELTLQGKTTLYDFYHCMLRITDPLKLDNVSQHDRYPEFHRVFRIWRNLKALKRAGRGLDPKGISATANGELAVECPACPHPGKNLPDNWQTAPLALRFLYTLFLAVDANFKLKNKERGINDFELDPGWGCYVESSRYFQHLDNHADQNEACFFPINSCGSDHNAIARANTAVPGYSVNGTALVLCSRHAVVRKNGVGDLPKGEKYCSIDYIILCTLIGTMLARIVISYDIACQWSKGFWNRMLEYPNEMKVPSETSVEVGIPNWHVNGHGAFCRDNLSLNYIPGVGRTCGEDVETSWAHTNPLASSTREMGPGARRETLNDHWGGWNFGKIIGFRTLFLKRFKDASVMMKKHRDSYRQFANTFPSETIQKWTIMVEDWKKDRTKPSPYAEPDNMTSLQDVRMELAHEDAKNTVAGIDLPHETTPTAFLMKGLDLEELQRTLLHEISQQKGQLTKKQMADSQEKRTGLYRRIEQWRQVQFAYTPAVASLLVTSSSSGSGDRGVLDSPEFQPLFLPSSIPTPLNKGNDVKVLAEKERRLRIAQADEALSDIRRGRRTITGLNQFKKFNISGAGNKPNTRMRVLYNRMTNKISRAAERYRMARAALLRLQPDGGDWSDRLRNLDQADIRGPGKATDDPRPVPNGRYEPSWIWLVPRNSETEVDDNEVKFDESLRAEWAKTLARKERWEEEQKLILEEMRRVIAYFAWKVEWWENQARRRTCVNAALAEGLQAYVARQVTILKNLADSSIQIWLPQLEKEGISPEWAITAQHQETTSTDYHLLDQAEEVLDDSEELDVDGAICDELDFEDF